MAQNDAVDTARIERLERRLQVLEDAEAIRNLKARARMSSPACARQRTDAGSI